jgi:hypothetical protein
VASHQQEKSSRFFQTIFQTKGKMSVIEELIEVQILLVESLGAQSDFKCLNARDILLAPQPKSQSCPNDEFKSKSKSIQNSTARTLTASIAENGCSCSRSSSPLHC